MDRQVAPRVPIYADCRGRSLSATLSVPVVTITRPQPAVVAVSLPPRAAIVTVPWPRCRVSQAGAAPPPPRVIRLHGPPRGSLASAPAPGTPSAHASGRRRPARPGPRPDAPRTRLPQPVLPGVRRAGRVVRCAPQVAVRRAAADAAGLASDEERAARPVPDLPGVRPGARDRGAPRHLAGGGRRGRRRGTCESLCTTCHGRITGPAGGSSWP